MSLQRRLAAGVILARANFQLFERPDRLARSLLAMAPWGTTLPGVVAAAAARYPDRIAIHDDDGSITYATLWDRSQRIAGFDRKEMQPFTGLPIHCEDGERTRHQG